MQIIKERKESGKGVDEFCIEKGISRNAYFYWQRKLREVACFELAKANEKEAEKCVPAGWMQLSSLTEESRTIHIEVSGCHIKVDSDTDSELLKKVCQILRAL